MSKHLPINIMNTAQASTDLVNELIIQSPIGFFRSTVTGAFCMVNPALVNMLGYTSTEEVLHLKIPDDLYMDPSQRNRIRQQYEPQGFMNGIELLWKRKDGQPLTVTLYSRTIRGKNREVVGYEGLVLDVTARKQAEAELRQLNINLAQRNDEWLAIHEISQALTATLDLREIYWVIYREIAQRIFDASHVIIALYNESSQQIICSFVIGDGIETDPALFPPMPLGTGPASQAILSRQPHIVDMRKAIPKMEASGNLVRVAVDGRDPQSGLYVPLICDDKVIGVMIMQHYGANAFRNHDLSLISILATQMSVALANAQLFAQGQGYARELEKKLTEIQWTERALRESESRYRALAENSSVGIWQLTKDGLTIYMNTRMREWLDVEDLAELAGETYHSFFTPESLKAIGRERKKRHQGLASSYEVELISRKGVHRIMLISGAPLMDLDGNWQGTVATFADITERRRSEEAMRQAQKLESLGVLAGGVAHDFNNLLVAMMGQTSLALKKIPSDSAAINHLEKALVAAERAALLTKQLLAYSGRGQFQIQPIQLNDVIEENLHLFEIAIPKHITLKTNLAPALPLIEADMGQIQQVVMNLILNAADAVEEQGGTITVKTGELLVAEGNGRYSQFTQLLLEPGLHVVLQINDTGKGMNAETISKIFDPFYSTKGAGRGLGLAAVLGIIRGHKGGLTVESYPNQGTTFQLLFPASTKVSTPLFHTADPGDSFATGTVLVIDDEEGVRDAVSDILSLDGWVVLTASNGQSGLDLYQTECSHIQLVLLDLSMPGLNGEQTLYGLRDINPAVKVILSSGYSEMEATKRMEGLAGFIQKPYSVSALLQIVRRVSGRGA